VQHTVLFQTAAVAQRFYLCFGRFIAEVNVALAGRKTVGHQAQFDGGFGQRRQVLELLNVRRAA
jgi:hypothetical protein